MIRRIVLALGAGLFMTWCAAPATAQDVNFLPRSAFHMGAEHIASDDERYVWDANFGGDLDFVDYGSGRLTFFANYQVILGEEYHAFDPNQGNYILTGAASRRLAGYEASFVFHHESRHLSDRFKRQPVDWNMVGGRLQKAFEGRGARLETRADLRGVIKRSFVDYRWEFDGDARGTYPIRPGISAVSDVDVRFLGVTGTADRGTQTGVRAEGGIRLEGRRAAVELFVAAERRVDPYPLEFGTVSWVTAGFRMLSR